MKRIEKFEMLAGRATAEEIPALDVSDKVMAILKNHQVQIYDRPLMWVAAISSAAAIPAAVAAIITYFGSSPLTELVKSISWVTQ